jgi:carboxypeptidase C (cathepsin A)
MTLIRHTAFLACLLLPGCGGGGGGGSSPPPPPPPPAFTDATVYSSLASASLATPSEATSITHAQVAVAGTTLAYTATTGHLTALAPVTRTPRASFFYVAYTLDGAAPATRPVTFFYNGGPGSASVWLHLGSFGPRRLATNAPDHNGPQPFPLVDNAESLLDVSDLVFVDAVGTGYSQAIAPNVNSNFWSVDSDAAAFRDFVTRYVEVNSRAASPKYLYGESYGGPRTAILATLLETAGVELAGVVLQSPAMDYSSNCDGWEGAVSCATYLPSYGAAGAWYAIATPSPAPAQIPDYMAQMRAYTRDVYAPVAAAWIASRAVPADGVVQQLAATTGLAQASWRANANPEPLRYRVGAQAGTLFGRYDARVHIGNFYAPGSEPDPSSTLITPSFTSRIAEYLTNTLLFTTPSAYTMFANDSERWNFAHAGAHVPDTIPDLGAAIAMNPRLKVMVVNGYHDLATPFYNTEQDVARLGAQPNITIRNYIGGHMTYLTDASRVAQKADLAAWYRSAPR